MASWNKRINNVYKFIENIMISTLPQSLIDASIYLLESSLYESMLLEDRIQFLKDRNQSIDTSHDPLAQHRNSNDIIDHFAQNADPSKNKQHTQWILGQYKKKNIRQEDAPTINDTLTEFEKYKSKLDKRDINQYKSVGEVSDAILPHIGTPITKKEETIDSIRHGHTLIHDDNGTKVYRLEPTEAGKKASQEIYGGGSKLGGAHTDWCTAARSQQCMFSHYNKDEDALHVIHTPDGEVYQAHVGTKQLMDRRNDDININSEGISKHKNAMVIGKALDHIPNGILLALNKRLPNITGDHINKAITNPDSSVRVMAIQHPSVTSENIDKALDDDNSNVIKYAIHHPNATSENIDKALDNENPNCRMYAINNPKATSKHIDKALDDENKRVRLQAIQHQNVTSKHIDKALDDHDDHVRIQAIQHRAVTSDNINKALDDRSEEVRYYAVMHPKATSENLGKAMNDKSSYIQADAAEIVKKLNKKV